MSFKTLVTTLGQAKIATAVANSSLVNLSEIAVGDGGGLVTDPSADQTALVREQYRAQINSLNVDANNPNWIVAELIVPSNVGGWTVREVGVFDNTGDLIAVGNFPSTYKPVIDEGSTRDLIVRIIIEVSDAAAVTLTIDPSVVLASRKWVSDNFSLSILLGGGTTGEVLRKSSNQDGDVEWFDPTDGTVILVDIVEENQQLVASQDVVTLSVATTDGMAVFIDGVRLKNTDYTINSGTQFTLDTAATGGEDITIVQNEPSGQLNFLRRADPFAEIAEDGAVAQETARNNLGIDTVAELKEAVLTSLYPVGEILITRRGGTPDQWLGFGTWERYGSGRSLVSYQSDDSSFNALDKTGGSKTHRLTASETPQFREFETITGYFSNGLKPVPKDGTWSSWGKTENNNGSGSDTGIRFRNETDASSAHNNLGPYIVVHMWKRTA